MLLTLVWLTWNPWRRSSAAKLRVLLQVHRNGDMGSPLVVGATIRSSVSAHPS
jgi:hypothetical protein